jgi:uncharacterized protein YbjT (DUF2867 family)
MPASDRERRVLVAGATGFIGRALLPALLATPRPLKVRVLGRRVPSSLPDCEVVAGSILDESVVSRALDAVSTAYYLVHSLPEPDFERREAAAATQFARAAAKAGVERIVYLGALGDDSSELSRHIRSRQETGRILRRGAVPTVELRASVVLGAGSAVFELVRRLTERLPLIFVPSGAERRCQPIALEDAVTILLAAAEHPEIAGDPLEIGGPEPWTYAELMLLYAELRGLKRKVVRMPIATPRLSGYWIRCFAGVSARVARELVLGLAHDSVVRDTRARTLLPLAPTSVRTAMQRAIRDAEMTSAAC